MATSHQIVDVFHRALQAMGDRPTTLENAAAQLASLREVALKDPIGWLSQYLNETETSSDLLWHYLGLSLREWDRLPEPEWSSGTSPTTDKRRSLIYKRLALPSSLANLLDKNVPHFIESQTPVVVAEEHIAWYDESHRKDRYYWHAYSEYLRTTRHWLSDSIHALNDATDSVVERLSNPSGHEAYPTKGLVVGYVQSGKTAHFTGVLAKAADAGYRLIIVLAGTLDILRQQTQRRIDKELLGKELVGNSYIADKDWNQFVSHGGRPSSLGHFDWDRLTGFDEDFHALKQGIAALDFISNDKSKPFFHPTNLRHAPVRLVVVKKHPAVINRLTDDLRDGRTRIRLGEIPALIIDDESDQASLNTLNPSKAAAEARTSTNLAITELLKTLPRAQYVGYTATPFANVLVNADEAETLFPRDFIISLPRPAGYMGVSDFYDLEAVPDDFTSKKRAFVREIEGEDDKPDNLQRALDCFVLTGAIKLFRSKKDSKKFKYEHHTMLIHSSVLKLSQSEQAKHVLALYQNSGYHSRKGLGRLRTLFEKDFQKVSASQDNKLPLPRAFETLEPFIAACCQKLDADNTVRIVNGDNKDDTPNFDKGPIWSILVGGTKLSRGYTVEGLTVSYFRRVSTQSDTLMQMGRWFGFRPGYRDLVRLFISKTEPIGKSGKKSLNIYEAFRAICLDEEEFRREILKYVHEGIRPIDIPPFVPSHMDALKPTAKNKMYNAQITFKNLGGESSEPTVAPTKKTAALENEKLAIKLLSGADLHEEKLGGTDARTKLSLFKAYVGRGTQESVLEFLSGYRWENNADVLRHQIEYLKGKHGSPSINEWIIIAPQLETVARTWPRKANPNLPALTVKERSRVLSRFGVYSEPAHRTVAKFLAGEGKAEDVNPKVRELFSPHRATMLFYPVRPSEGESFDTMGFSLYLPKNKLQQRLAYVTRRKGKSGSPDPVVIDK